VVATQLLGLDFVNTVGPTTSLRMMPMYRLAVILLLIWPSIAARATEGPAGAPPDAAEAVQRFDGYLYMDIDGNPLPIQTDLEVEQFLAEAEVIDSSLIGTGITIPRKLVLQGDGFRVHAVFKDVDVERHRVTERVNGRNRFSLDWYDSHRFDTAAYKLDRLLGLDRVPPSVFRQVGAENGTIRIWLEKTVTEHTRSRKLDIEPPDYRRWHQQYLLMRLFDNLVANRDSNLGNLLIDPNWRMWFIDCTRCFGKTESIYFPLEEFEHCERGFWNGLLALDETRTREVLSPYLDRGEIKSLLARRDKMIRHFQKLIDERGEVRVLYDVVPPAAKAPWGE
jgi:hypothetical protein